MTLVRILRAGLRFSHVPGWLCLEPTNPKEEAMKQVFGAVLVAAALGLCGTAVTAAPAGVDLRAATPEPMIEKAQSERTCRRLRRACMFKHERGEAGEGNCRRYRRTCERWWR
jgi:hypothetical protein